MFANFMNVLKAIWAFILFVAPWIFRLSPPLISVFIAAVVLGFLPEARDLLLSRDPWWRLAVSLLIVVVLWCAPLYAMVRGTLSMRGATPVVTAIIAGLFSLFPLVILWAASDATQRAIVRCEVIQTYDALNDCLKQPLAADVLTLTSVTAGIIDPSTEHMPAAAGALQQISQVQMGIGIAALLVLAGGLLVARLIPLTPASPWAGPLRLLLGLLALAFVVVAFVAPFSYADWFGKLSLLALIAGSWLAIANAVLLFPVPVRWGVVIVVVAIYYSGIFLERFNDVRTFKSPWWEAANADQTGTVPTRQAFLDAEITRWMELNGCEASTKAAPCERRPILIAAEGGASRSAFFVSTMLGALIDYTRDNPGYPDLRTSIFAMSGVSGGALGLATLRAALADQRAGYMPPCKAPPESWFGDDDTPGSRDVTTSWRACLQALTSGDLLTAPLIGFVLGDNAPIFSPMDRSAMLEVAIERNYNTIVGDGPAACEGDADRRGFCRPVGYLSQEASWLPILILNATEVGSGRPILISDVQTRVVRCTIVTDCPDFFRTAHNIFELYARDPRTRPDTPLADQVSELTVGGLGQAADLRLSTATVLSARFPGISSAGHLRFAEGSKSFITARIVDGGYFDNSGLQSISLLLPHLVDRGLRPIIIYLRASPWFEQQLALPGSKIVDTSFGDILESRLDVWAGNPVANYISRLFSEPVAALVSARNGHVETVRESLRNLSSRLGNVSIEQLMVMEPMTPWAGSRNVPSLCLEQPPKSPYSRSNLYSPVMNWWLSPLTQASLDAQVCDRRNSDAIWRILEDLNAPPKASAR